MPNQTRDALIEIADDHWQATALDEFSNRRFIDRMTRFSAEPSVIDPLAGAGGLTALRPVSDRLQRRFESRRSGREFADRALDQRTVERLLAATGTDEQNRRVIPSAGGLGSVTTFAICRNTEGAGAGRIVRYDAQRHALADVCKAPDDDRLSTLLNLGEDSVPAIAIVFVAHLTAVRAKYGGRGDRFVLIETGCAAQNVELRVAQEHLAGYQLGGVREELGALLGITGIPARITGALAIGHPSNS